MLGKRGFTLIELLVAMSIFTLIIGAVFWIFITSLRDSGIIWEQLKTQNDGRRVLQEVVDDARRAEESSIGSYAIVVADDNELIFYANIDNDSYRERVHFWLATSTLKKGVIKPSGNPLSYPTETEQVVELAHDVANIAESMPVFIYYGVATGTEALPELEQPVTVSDVRVIRVQLELEKDPTESPVPLHVESLVHMRSLKDN